MSRGASSRQRPGPESRGGAASGHGPAGTHVGPGLALAAALLLLGLALYAYAPAMAGPFLSDDQHYVERNPYVHDLSFETLAAIVEPNGPASRTIENWAPVQLILHGLA